MKITLCGNYGDGNFGDELILEGLIRTLKDFNTKMEITVLSANPQETIEKFAKYDVKALNKFPAGIRSFFKGLFNGNFKKTYKEVKSSDFFILGGGGLFDESRKASNLIWGIQAWFAYRLKRKVIMYGQNLGGIKSKLALKYVKRFFRKAEFIAVRDEDSKNFLRKFIKGKKIMVMPDLVFKIPVKPNTQNAQNDEKSKTTTANTANTAVLALRKIKERPQDFDQNIKNFTKLLKQQNYSVKALNFHRKDAKYQQEFTENHLDYSDKDAMLESYSKAKIILGMRLHSILLAIRTRTPFIALNYNPKVQNILETLGLSQYLLELDQVTPAKLNKLLIEISHNYAQIQEKLERITQHQEESFQKVEEHLKKALGI